MIWTDPPYGYENASGRDFLARRKHIMENGNATTLKLIANDDKELARALIDMILKILVSTHVHLVAAVIFELILVAILTWRLFFGTD